MEVDGTGDIVVEGTVPVGGIKAPLEFRQFDTGVEEVFGTPLVELGEHYNAAGRLLVAPGATCLLVVALQ